jgi:16S rRNA (uracil1498-N3)-methyltransferase
MAPSSAHTFSFYWPALTAADPAIRLDGEEHGHLKRVLRLRRGEVVHVTNGAGLVVRATIQSVDKDATELQVDAVQSDTPPAARLVLALPLLQRTHFETAVAQCVEVGVTAFVPLLTEKGHVRAWTPAQQARAERVAVAAMKQSGRSWLPSFAAAVDVEGLAAALGQYGSAVLADATAEPLAGGSPGDSIGIVGPEAGFSAAETATLRAAGARPVSLSGHRLRAETAALVLVSILARR